MVVGDWGAAGCNKEHFGSTPIYASPVTFEANRMKDLFAFGQIAFELFFDQSGKLVKFSNLRKKENFIS